MERIILKSPAKLNLYLDVLARREDGYHNIETVFERINLCDNIILEKLSRGIELFCDEPKLKNKDNLAYRAAEAILNTQYSIRNTQYARHTPGVRIIIKKKIPVGAGLGGASSNAASVLDGLNRLWKLNLAPRQIFLLAKELGADVPFFLSGYPFAIGKGRGDRIQALSVTSNSELRTHNSKLILWHVLVYPDIVISTDEAYKDLTQNLWYSKIKNKNINNIVGAFKKNDLNLMGRAIFNVFEPWASMRFPIIGRIKMLLVRGGAIAASLSGTGSTVYGIVGSRSEAINLSSFMSRRLRNCQIFVANTTLDGGQ